MGIDTCTCCSSAKATKLTSNASIGSIASKRYRCGTSDRSETRPHKFGNQSRLPITLRKCRAWISWPTTSSMARNYACSLSLIASPARASSLTWDKVSNVKTWCASSMRSQYGAGHRKASKRITVASSRARRWTTGHMSTKSHSISVARVNRQISPWSRASMGGYARNA